MKRAMILGLIALTGLLFVVPSADAHRGRHHAKRTQKVVVVAKSAPVVKVHLAAQSVWVAGHWTWCGPSIGYRWVPGHRVWR